MAAVHVVTELLYVIVEVQDWVLDQGEEPHDDMQDTLVTEKFPNEHTSNGLNIGLCLLQNDHIIKLDI